MRTGKILTNDRLLLTPILFYSFKRKLKGKGVYIKRVTKIHLVNAIDVIYRVQVVSSNGLFLCCYIHVNVALVREIFIVTAFANVEVANVNLLARFIQNLYLDCCKKNYTKVNVSTLSVPLNLSAKLVYLRYL